MNVHRGSSPTESAGLLLLPSGEDTPVKRGSPAAHVLEPMVRRVQNGPLWPPKESPVSILISPDLSGPGWFLEFVEDTCRTGSPQALLCIDPRSFDPDWFRRWNRPNREGWWIDARLNLSQLAYHPRAVSLPTPDAREQAWQQELIEYGLRGLFRVANGMRCGAIRDGLVLVSGRANAEVHGSQVLCIDESTVVGMGCLMLARDCSHPYAMLNDARLTALDAAEAELNTASKEESIVADDVHAHVRGRTHLTVFGRAQVHAEDSAQISVVGQACAVTTSGRARVKTERGSVYRVVPSGSKAQSITTPHVNPHPASSGPCPPA